MVVQSHYICSSNCIYYWHNAYLVYKYNISIYDNVMHNIKQIYCVNALTNYVDICTIKTVFDLLDCRDSICTVNGFTMSNTMQS